MLEVRKETLDLEIEEAEKRIYRFIESKDYQKDLKFAFLKKCLSIENEILNEFEISSKKVLKKHINLNGYKLSKSMKIRKNQIYQVKKNLSLLSNQKNKKNEDKINKLKEDLKYLKLIQQSEINKKKEMLFERKIYGVDLMEIEKYRLKNVAKEMIISLRKKYIRRRNRIKVIESDLRKFSPKIQYEVCHNLTYGRLNWKILPSGEMSFERLINYYNKLQKENTHRVYEKERLDLIENLNPSKRYIGLGQFKSYVVYRFNYTEKAILENPYKGNAIYILSGDWRKLSQMSKSELLDTNLTHVQRIVHNGNWYDKLQQAICD